MGAGVKKLGANRFAVVQEGQKTPIERQGRPVIHSTRPAAQRDAAQTTRRVLGPQAKGAAKTSKPSNSPRLKK